MIKIVRSTQVKSFSHTLYVVCTFRITLLSLRTVRLSTILTNSCENDKQTLYSVNIASAQFKSRDTVSLCSRHASVNTR